MYIQWKLADMMLINMSQFAIIYVVLRNCKSKIMWHKKIDKNWIHLLYLTKITAGFHFFDWNHVWALSIILATPIDSKTKFECV